MTSVTFDLALVLIVFAVGVVVGVLLLRWWLRPEEDQWRN